MIHTIEKRHEFGGGQMFTHYEVIQYERRYANGFFGNGKTLKRGTLKECRKYCRTKGIPAEEII